MEPTLNDITKTAFLCGYSPQNWLAVVQDLKHPGPPAHAASEICAAIFSLLEVYPLSPILLDYLSLALDSSPQTHSTPAGPTLPIGIYIAALIAWSQSVLTSPTSALTPDQLTQTLSALCAIAAPRAQKPNAHLAPTLPTAQGCISLVQHVHMHHAHDVQLIAATLDILSALLQTVTATPPNPNLSPALALHLVPALNDFWMLSALTTEGAPHASTQSPLPTDEPAGGAIQRPELLEFTRKNTALFDTLAYELTSALTQKEDHLSALHTVFNLNQSNLEAFYSQLYASLLSILAAETDLNTRLLIRATIFGSVRDIIPNWVLTNVLADRPTRAQLPTLLRQLEAQVESQSPLSKLREALQSAVSGLFTDYSALLDKCDAQPYHAALVHGREDSMEEDAQEGDIKGKNIRTTLVQSLQCVSLLDSNYTASAALGLENWPGRGTGRLFVEAGENGLELEGYIKSRLSSETPLADGHVLLDQAIVDPETHTCLCAAIHQGYARLSGSTQHMSSTTLEALAHLSRLLYTHSSVLDILSLRVPPSELVAAGLAFLEDFDYAGVGDPQSAMGQYGDVLLLVQLLIARYELRNGMFKHGERSLDASYLTSSWAVYNLVDLGDSERILVNDWVKAAFDSGSVGIDDTILRSTSPRVLLKLCATLFAEAIRKCAAEPEAAGKEILRNGASYFEGPLLSWTLRGVIWALANEAERHGHAAQTHLEILQLLVLAPGCPPPVLEMTRHRVLRLLASPHVPKASIDVNAMMRVLQPFSTTGSTGASASVLHPASYLNLALQNMSGSIGMSGSVPIPIPNPARVLPYATPLALLRAPVHQVTDSVAHRNVLIALLTLSRPRFAALRYVLAGSVGGVGGAVGTGMDSDFFAGVIAGAIAVWLATPGERVQARVGVKRFVKECEQEKGGEGVARRLMGLEYVRVCVASA
ncbi:mediator complex subunit Med5 [Ceratobasidium sp. AG-Ba]|nr:mediator complex subunit Med5 [Ceratobasidium sp. AG-Ba]